MFFKKFIIFSFVVITAGGNAQQLKHLSDTSFSINDRILAPQIPLSLSGSSWRYLPFIDSVNRISDFLSKFPKLIVEIGCHTDSRGNKENNLKQTEHKAQHIRDYLVQKKGIDSARVSWKGYGGEVPLAGEDEIRRTKDRAGQERLHEKNRRTEIKVMGKLD